MFKYENSDSVLIGFNQHFLLPENIHERIFFSGQFGRSISESGGTLNLLEYISGLFLISKPVLQKKLLILYTNTYSNTNASLTAAIIKFTNGNNYNFQALNKDNFRLFIDLSNVDEIQITTPGSSSAVIEVSFNFINK